MNVITTGNGLGEWFVTMIPHGECCNHGKVSMLTIWPRQIVRVDSLVMGNGHGGCLA